MRAPPATIAAARRLRRNLSPPEAMLWTRLRARTPGMPTFRRQHPIGPYVLDFFCAGAKLAIEIDGTSHDTADRPERDLRRDAWLESQGVKVMRIAAGDVLRSPNDAADSIVRTALAMIGTRGPRPLHHASHGPPAPRSEGG
jgi:very-short-patch-repair endonuclease